MKLIFATGNKGKLREAREILQGFEVLSPTEAGLGPEALDVEENGSSFAENSRIKAEHLAALLPGTVAVIADDSGLVVDALGGAPGIYSARYSQLDSRGRIGPDIRYRHAQACAKNCVRAYPAPASDAAKPDNPAAGSAGASEANIAKLLRELEAAGAMAAEQRRARFVCVATLIAGGRTLSIEGRCEGRIAQAPEGDGGFGYDPVFVADAFPDRSLACVPEDDKNSISHRGEALRKLAEWLRQSNS